ncbi:MAG: hypothetical protein LIO81_03460 [Clostridiales bacterium]|nr:hypothetical protein [Clostridiales bacterium]
MKKQITLLLTGVLLASIPTITALAGEWKDDENGRWYVYDDGNYPVSTWDKVDDNWYYFDENGYLLTDAYTPDGYYVDENGVCVEETAEETVAEESAGAETAETDSEGESAEGEAADDEAAAEENGETETAGPAGSEAATEETGETAESETITATETTEESGPAAVSAESETEAAGETEAESSIVIENLGYPVDVWSTGFGKDKNWGVEPRIAFRNNSGKTIKTIAFELTPYNEWDAVVYSGSGSKSTLTVTAKGPFKTDVGIGSYAYSSSTGLVTIKGQDTDAPYYTTSGNKKVVLDPSTYAKTFNNVQSWESTWFNDDIYYLILSRVDIEYEDGTKESIPKEILMFRDKSIE